MRNYLKIGIIFSYLGLVMIIISILNFGNFNNRDIPRILLNIGVISSLLGIFIVFVLGGIKK